VIIKDK